MTRSPEDLARQDRDAQFAADIGAKAARKAQARDKNTIGSMWFGLGTFGMVGWSVAVPALLGVLLGIWLDSVTATAFSWRLTLMIVGVVIGCLNAWYWVSKEQRHIEAERERRYDE